MPTQDEISSYTSQDALAMILTMVAPNGKKHGSISALAEILNISPQAVQQWRVVPLHHVPTLVDKLGVDEWQIRPDHYRPRIVRKESSA